VSETGRPRDEVWDTMEELFGHVASGTNAHKKRNKAVKDLKLLDATPALIVRAKHAYHSIFAGACCTDIALATHYPMLAPRTIDPPCSSCGVGGGHHSSDCDAVTLRRPVSDIGSSPSDAQIF
jgi:hypothetical protein